MKKIICKVIEMLYPAKCAEIRAERAETNRARRDAMQAMLDANRALRAKGIDTNRINDRLSDALWQFNEGQFSTAASWAEMEGAKPSWAATC